MSGRMKGQWRKRTVGGKVKESKHQFRRTSAARFGGIEG